MVRDLGDGIYQIRGTLVTSYLLVDSQGVTLIDSGFTQHVPLIEQALALVKLQWSDINAILLTHGHLDHTLNLAQIRKQTKAPIYAHPLEQQHIAGTYPYCGFSRVCGWLEWWGRTLLRYQPIPADRRLTDFEVLDFFGGLQVIRLPGHTKGHCGFYSNKCGILFSGDLFATGKLRSGLPWFWLNSSSTQFPYSLNKVLAMNPDGILSNHCDTSSASQQKEAFFNRFSSRSKK
jgi:glyoxylase-like metal-dependent hydrolase (beta-lactamase superfamily II)